MSVGQSSTTVVLTVPDLLQKMVCECDESVEHKSGQSCMDLGTEKHDCVDEKIQKHNEDEEDPRIGSEMGWQRFIDPETDLLDVHMLPGARRRTPQRMRAGSVWPDAVAFDSAGDPQQCFDFKFKCPTAKYPGPPRWGRGQRAKQAKLTKMWGHDPNKYPPTMIPNTNC